MLRKRQLFRVAIDRTGRVQQGGKTVPCQVVNLTDKGVRLRLEQAFALNDSLELQFPLSKRSVLACTIRVTYVEPPFVGGAITYISNGDQSKLSHFIDEVNTLSMTGF